MDRTRLQIQVHLAAEDIAVALLANQADIENELRSGVVQAMAESNIAEEARRMAKDAIKRAVQDSIERFFRYDGRGRKAIEASIRAAAEKAIEETAKRVD